MRSDLDHAPISESERLELERLREELAALRAAAGHASAEDMPHTAREHAHRHGLFGVVVE